MTSSLRQFRDRYPHGSLTSELVQATGDEFIVRSLIHIDGTLVASGMAASPQVEIAEDQARQRALAVLGFENNAPETPPLSKRPIVATAIPEVPLSPPPQGMTATPGSSIQLQDDSIPPKDDPLLAEDETEWAPWPEDVQPASTPIQPAMVSDRPLTIAASKPSERTIKVTGVNGEGITGGTAKAEPEPKAESPTAPVPLPAPVDLSDVIAQTDVELQRLGWSVGQGRDHLETTYGKRSRHDLSDEELLEFLLYLESLDFPLEG
jgi:hypothetical protein